MPIQASWPYLLNQHYQKTHSTIRVINASVSGDTTGNGLARLPTQLTQHQPDIVLIELGANDGLRGFHPNIIKKNLKALIQTIESHEAQALLMQIHVLPNYGQRYTEMFSQLYPKLATQLNVPLIPFFLTSILENPEWMMKDGLHPNEKAQPWIANFMAETLQPYVLPTTEKTK